MSKLRLLLLALVIGAGVGLALGPQLTYAADQSTLKMWQDGDAGERLSLRGRVVSAGGQPIPDARIQMRQADGNTQYTEQYSGVVFSNEKGTFKVLTVVPGQYSSAKHIHIYVYAEGYKALNTDILFKGDPNIDLGSSGGIEVLLEQVSQGEQATSVGAVEIVMQPIGG